MSVIRTGVVCSVLLILACRHTGGSSILEAGADVPLLPDGRPVKESCPEKARRIMRILKLRPGTALTIQIDANQIEREPLAVFAGPIESIVVTPVGRLDGGTRLYGWVWASKRGAVIRYYRAQMPGNNVIPICAEAHGRDGELASKPWKYPQSVEFQSSWALAVTVDEFL